MSQYNDIKITPNSGVSSDPKIEFTGAGNSTITLKVTDGTSGEIVFENEDQKELLSLVDGSSTDPIFSVNDSISLPALQVYEDGRLLLAPYAGYNIGIGTTNPTAKLDVAGDLNVSGIITATTLNSYNVGTDAGISTTRTTVATTSATTIESFSATTHRSARVQVQITQGTDYQASDVLVIHNGSTANLIEYGSIATNDYLGDFTATISGGNVLLQINMVSATSATVKTFTQKITI